MDLSVKKNGAEDDPPPRKSFVLGHQYRFSLEAALRSLVGERGSDLEKRDFPGGQRVYLEYQLGRITSSRACDSFADDNPDIVIGGGADKRAGKRPPLFELLAQMRTFDPDDRSASPPIAPEAFAEKGLWAGLSGEIANSGDWALLRNDAILVLDGRFTIRANDGTALAAFMAGTVDLSAAYNGVTRGEAYRMWLAGERPHNDTAPVRVSLRFDVPSGLGDKASTAARRYVQASRYWWKYQRLARGTFVGVGEVVLSKTKIKDADTGYADRLTLDVFEVDAAPSEK